MIRSLKVLCFALAAFPTYAADDASMRAAFHFAFPVYEMARTRAQALGTRDGPGPQVANNLAHRTALADHNSRRVTAPNNDTLYSAAWLDLAGGPVALDMPALPNRYHSVAMMDLYTDNFAILGTRASGGKGGRVLVVGPAWNGTAPADATLVRAPTNDVWLLIRTLVDGPDDLAAARVAQAGFKLDAMGNHGRPLRHAAPVAPDAATFIDVVNEMLARGPIPPAHAARLESFAALGIRPGARFDELSAASQAAWRDNLPRFIAGLRDDVTATGAPRTGWLYPKPGLGNFGTDDLFRARVALGGLAALPPEEAMYLGANQDATGRPLDGSKRYRLRVPAGGLPVHERGFWSLSMYEVMPDGRRFFISNPIGRYSIGNRTPGLKPNADGSLDVLIQHAPPAATANWLPAPSGPFRLVMRAYLPKPLLVDQRWTLPAVETLD